VGNRVKLNKTLPWVPEAWQTEILASLWQPMRKTGTEHFHSSFSLNFDLFYCITFKPITANISHYDHMDLHMKTTKFAWHSRSGLVWIHGFCGTKNYITLPWKRFLIQSLHCHAIYLTLNVVCNGGYYSLESENAQELKIFKRISTLFTVKDDNLSIWLRILCSVLPTGRKIWSNCQRSRKFKLRISQKESIGKKKLQMVKIRIQKAVPAFLVHRHLEYCVVRHRVQEFTELARFSWILLAKPPKHPCYN